jgi:V/A-type H+-transporting ATPase subunit A
MSVAVTHWLSGPVLRARPEGTFLLREAVRVGEQGLLGEVIGLARDEIVVQVYEDTSGLRPGTRLIGSGQLLSVRLGPGLLGGVFDGLLRPIAEAGSGAFVTPGTQPYSAAEFAFTPSVNIGQALAPGHCFGTVQRPGMSLTQRCLCPPRTPAGTVSEIAAAGVYPEDQTLCQVRDESGALHPLSLCQDWPVRQPRPVAARLPSDQPMITGQRILDCLFPLARGGKAAIPGGFGTGKTVLLETIAKWCDADIIVYVGCGERGNEMAGLLDELTHLEDPRSGRLLKERAVIIANTSNMPVSAREASIYTGVTVAEYFRDQGLHVALMADSTSRWAEALREVSGRLGELPGEGGYPAYLSSRLADFFERAAKVRTLGGEQGSVTLLSAVSPPSGDFSEPVTAHTRRYVRCLWALDAQRAHARFYPAIHPLQSYSEEAANLARWWHGQGCTRWEELRRRFLVLLERQAHLERMARVIGKDALPPRQRYTLLCAELISEAFLRQSAFSVNERYASPARQSVMMRLLGRFIELGEEALQSGALPEELSQQDVYRQLLRMGEDIGDGEWERFSLLDQQLESRLATLRRGTFEATQEAPAPAAGDG